MPDDDNTVYVQNCTQFTVPSCFTSKRELTPHEVKLRAMQEAREAQQWAWTVQEHQQAVKDAQVKHLKDDVLPLVLFSVFIAALAVLLSGCVLAIVVAAWRWTLRPRWTPEDYAKANGVDEP